METEPDSKIVYSFLPMLLLTAIPSEVVALLIATLFLLLILSAFISASGVAISRLSEADFERLSASYKPLTYIQKKPRQTIVTIRISNLLINIAIIILCDILLRQLIPDTVFQNWANAITRFFDADAVAAPTSVASILSFSIAIVGIAFLLILFGEAAPSVYAQTNHTKVIAIMARPLHLLMLTFSPVNSVLIHATTLLELRFSKFLKKRNPERKEKIDEAIELTVNNEKDSKQEADILRGIVKFNDVTVKQIMTPRVDVVAVDTRTNYQDLLQVVKESGYSRIPVYENDLDNIKGILYVKDLLGCLKEDANFDWQHLIRSTVLYVPEAKKISDLLKEFQKQHLHMAVVVDEYGGSSGIVTMEDVLEEIIGDIRDEFDDEAEVIYKKIDDHNFLFEGKTSLNDLYRIAGITNDPFEEIRGEADSLAGLILEIHGELPKKDMELTYNDFRFKIVSVSKRRIEQVQITLPAV